jgi:hypothetical protein
MTSMLVVMSIAPRRDRATGQMTGVKAHYPVDD